MATTDTSVSPGPYFKVHDGKMAEFKALCEKMVDKTATEAGALYCGFCFDGDEVFAREAYTDADAWVAHLGNVGELFGELLKVADLTRLEVHGPEAELVKVRKTLSDMGMKAAVYSLECGFRK